MSPTAPHELMHTQHTTHEVPFIKYKHKHSHTLSPPLHKHSHAHSPLPSTFTLPPALCHQIKLRLQLLVDQPLLDLHQWTSVVVHFVHHFGLGLTDSHNLSYSTIGCERGQGRERFGGVIAVNFLAGSYTDCPTVTTTLLTPLHPGLITRTSQLSFPHSKQPFSSLEDTNTHHCMPVTLKHVRGSRQPLLGWLGTGAV